MAGRDGTANGPVSLTDSKVCGSCEGILGEIDHLAANPAIFRQGLGEQSHGFICLKDAGIKAAACHLCALFVSLFTNDEQSKLEVDRLRIQSHWRSSGTLLDLLVGKKSLVVSQGAIERLLPTHDRVDPMCFDPSTWSKRALGRVDVWLNNCVMGHQECSQGTSPGFLPSRLIDIGWDSDASPRLVESSILRGCPRYVSLSHCWGGKVPLVLRKDSFAAMRTKLDYEDLPKTFQQALTVTRDLKCQYIWIDSLCIIQDSHEDWVKESSLMDQVYSNAFCNIAASAAGNSTVGLFFHRNPGSLVPLRITTNKRVYLLDPPHVNIYRIVEQSPLNSRGWVYQERFLSPRTLHFTASQVFWECKTHCTCETNPIIYPHSEISLPPIKRFKPELDGMAIRQRDGGHILNISQDAFLNSFAVWKEIVAKYSKRGLTEEADKLVAISGIAAKVNDILDDEYLAGMWREHLPYSLLWQAFGENKKPKTYTAPSWSWASICGGVQTKSLKNLKYKHSVEIIEAVVELAGPNKFGQVKGGFIKLQGSLMAIPLSICHSGESKDPLCIGCKEDSETLSLRFVLDISRPEVDRFEEARQRLHFPIASAKNTGRSCPEELYEHLVVYGVPIITYWAGHRREVEGLLLKASGNKIGEFSRVGTFSHEAWRDAQGKVPSQCFEAFRSFDSQAADLGLGPIPSNHPDHDV